MIDKERAIQTVVEDMGARERLSAIRKGLESAGFSPEEIHEIISEAIERRKTGRQEREASGIGAGTVVMILAVLIMAVTFVWTWTPSGWAVLVPGGLFVYGAYLWYGKPGSE